MHNLFYVPPHQPQDHHPRPRGVKSVVKRNQPTRNDLTLPTPGLVTFDLGADLPPAEATSTRSTALRHRLGRLLIRAGQALTGPDTTPLGQPG